MKLNNLTTKLRKYNYNHGNMVGYGRPGPLWIMPFLTCDFGRHLALEEENSTTAVVLKRESLCTEYRLFTTFLYISAGISDVIKNRTVSQIQVALQRKAYADAGIKSIPQQQSVVKQTAVPPPSSAETVEVDVE